MTNSRQKGARGERQWAAKLSAEGFPARRGQQFSGSKDSPDVVCPALAHLHCEVKLTERLQLYDAMEQAIRDAGDKTPYVAHRRNNHDWLVIMRADDWLEQQRELIPPNEENDDG